MLNSPGASPVAIVPGVGVGVGDGNGLGAGVAAATGKTLAPVKNDSTAVDSLVTVGVNRRKTSEEPSALPPPRSEPARLKTIRFRVCVVSELSSALQAQTLAAAMRMAPRKSLPEVEWQRAAVGLLHSIPCWRQPWPATSHQL